MSLLTQIQNEILDSTIPASTILRKAYVLARQIDDKDFIEWTQNELNGYNWDEFKGKSSFPEYRRPGGYLEGIGPFNIRKPVQIREPEIYEKICRPPIITSIPEIEAQLSETPSSKTIYMTVAPEVSAALCEGVGMELQLSLAYSKANFQGIVDTVKNKLLEIAIDLTEKTPDIEKRTPTTSEKREIGAHITQIINNPQGCQFIAGKTVDLSFQDFKGVVEGTLSSDGVEKKKITELIEVLDEAEEETPPKKTKTLPKKIGDFLKSNKAWITKTAIEIINDFWRAP